MTNIAYGYRDKIHGQFESNQRFSQVLDDGRVFIKFKGGVKGVEWIEILSNFEDMKDFADWVLENYDRLGKNGR